MQCVLIQINSILGGIDLRDQSLSQILESRVIFVQVSTDNCNEKSGMISLASQCLLCKAQITGDGTLNEAFISQLIDKFILLRDVKVSDRLKHWLNHGSEGDLIVARSLFLIIDGFTSTCCDSLNALADDVTLSEANTRERLSEAGEFTVAETFEILAECINQ